MVEPMTDWILRPTRDADLAFVTRAEADPDTRPFIRRWTIDDHRRALANPDIRHLIVTPAAEDHPLGLIILAGLSGPNQSIEFMRIVITEKGHGYGRAAVRLVERYAFEELGAHRLWLDVKVANHRARALYTSEGFVEEGVQRECLKTEQGFESLILMSMLRHEYRTGPR